MKRILVTGAGGSASYNYIQSLRDNPGKEKFYIIGTDVEKYHIELSPVDNRYILPPVDHPAYLYKLNKLIEKEEIDFLHTQPDKEAQFIIHNKHLIHAKTLLPSPLVIDICQEKMRLINLLADAGIRVPESYLIDSETTLKKAFHHLKNDAQDNFVWLRAKKGAGSRAALPVHSLQHAKMWIDYWGKEKGLGYGHFMASEFLPGKEFAFQSLWKDGKLLMSQARERIEYIFGNLTPSGQSSSPSVAKTVHNDEVNSLGYKAVRAIDLRATGVFCIDMKTNRRGKIAITEVNAGRFFTTSYFLSKAGINMPYYYTKLGLGEEVFRRFKRFNAVDPNLYWIRMVDMGYKLTPNIWTSKKI